MPATRAVPGVKNRQGKPLGTGTSSNKRKADRLARFGPGSDQGGLEFSKQALETGSKGKGKEKKEEEEEEEDPRNRVQQDKWWQKDHDDGEEDQWWNPSGSSSSWQEKKTWWSEEEKKKWLEEKKRWEEKEKSYYGSWAEQPWPWTSRPDWDWGQAGWQQASSSRDWGWQMPYSKQ